MIIKKSSINNNTQLVISKSEWLKIGLASGWINNKIFKSSAKVTPDYTDPKFYESLPRGTANIAAYDNAQIQRMIANIPGWSLKSDSRHSNYIYNNTHSNCPLTETTVGISHDANDDFEKGIVRKMAMIMFGKKGPLENAIINHLLERAESETIPQTDINTIFNYLLKNKLITPNKKETPSDPQKIKIPKIRIKDGSGTPRLLTEQEIINFANSLYEKNKEILGENLNLNTFDEAKTFLIKEFSWMFFDTIES